MCALWMVVSRRLPRRIQQGNAPETLAGLSRRFFSVTSIPSNWRDGDKELSMLPEYSAVKEAVETNSFRRLDAETTRLLQMAEHLSPAYQGLCHLQLGRLYRLTGQADKEQQALEAALGKAESICDEDRQAFVAQGSVALAASVLRQTTSSSEEHVFAKIGQAVAAATEAASNAGNTPSRCVDRARAVRAISLHIGGESHPGASVNDAAGPLEELAFSSSQILPDNKESCEKVLKLLESKVDQYEPELNVVGSCKMAEALAAMEEYKSAEETLTKALKMSKTLDQTNPIIAEPLLGLANMYAWQGEVVMAEGLYRSCIDRLEGFLSTSPNNSFVADYLCRSLSSFAYLLRQMEFNNKPRVPEALQFEERRGAVQRRFPFALYGADGDQDRTLSLEPWVLSTEHSLSKEDRQS